ncbi:MAG TPA: WYL domain-containing protein [Bacteroidia bacterium]|nr:WYL domain-containing protein [Bacteroidia bacterium]
MPINKLALIRYKTIDNCLQNRFRKWTLDDLVEACSRTLDEFEGIDQGVSKRTVQLDIQTMRSEKLGYNAPIIVSEKKYYSYEDKGYSITNIPLTSQDMGTLTEVVEVLRQFKGFSYFEELTGMVNKLEDKIHTQKNKGKSYIHFEKNDLLKGLDHIDPLHKAIMRQKTLDVVYQSFKAREAGNIIFYPYMLKEYRNRWFVIGATQKKTILTLALDRIASVKELSSEKYMKNTFFEIDTYFDDTIGVTKNMGVRPQQVVLKVDRAMAPYVITKPIHPSQKILRTESDGVIFSINVTWNFELERELLGFGEQIAVLSPKRLQNRITWRIRRMAERYEQQEAEKD